LTNGHHLFFLDEGPSPDGLSVFFIARKWGMNEPADAEGDHSLSSGNEGGT
jgi:hypothetical protein